MLRLRFVDAACWPDETAAGRVRTNRMLTDFTAIAADSGRTPRNQRDRNGSAREEDDGPNTCFMDGWF